MSQNFVIVCVYYSVLLLLSRTCSSLPVITHDHDDSKSLLPLPVIENPPRSTPNNKNEFRDLTLLVEAGKEAFGVKFDEPILQKKFSYNRDFGPVNINAFVKDINVHGLSKYDDFHMTLDKTNKMIHFDFSVPVVQLETDSYKMGGKVVFFPIKGSGSARIDCRDVTIQGHANYEKVSNEVGDTVIQLRKTVIDVLEMKDVIVRMTGMFDGNPLMSALSHWIANNYWKDIFELGKPDLVEYTAAFVEDLLLNPVLKQLPYISDYVDDK